jgi:hypothetical protein
MYSFILAERVLHFAGNLDVRELNTPIKSLEVQKERMNFSHNDHEKDYDGLPSQRGHVATPIKTPRPCLAATPLLVSLNLIIVHPNIKRCQLKDQLFTMHMKEPQIPEQMSQGRLR